MGKTRRGQKEMRRQGLGPGSRVCWKQGQQQIVLNSKKQGDGLLKSSLSASLDRHSFHHSWTSWWVSTTFYLRSPSLFNTLTTTIICIVYLYNPPWHHRSSGNHHHHHNIFTATFTAPHHAPSPEHTLPRRFWGILDRISSSSSPFRFSLSSWQSAPSS